MTRRTPSIEDIAKAAGVANSTVSRALHDSPLISDKVRARIQRLASEMGYTPNGIAQSLQNQRSYTIGLVVTSIADPFFADVVKGVEDVARAAGYSVFLSSSHNDPTQELAVIETFQRRRVDAIVVADSQISSNHMQRLIRVDVPTVLVNSQTEDQTKSLVSVSVDDFGGAKLAVEHLLALGHRSIGYLGVGNRPKSNRRRLEGYRAALEAASVPFDQRWVAVAPAADTLHEDDVAAGQTLLAPLLAAGVSAVFCYNDMIAIGALLACREQEMMVPRSLSVIGFDDIPSAQYVTPPLTTVRQPKYDLGRLAMQSVLQLLDGQPATDYTLQPEVVVRASTLQQT